MLSGSAFLSAAYPLRTSGKKSEAMKLTTYLRLAKGKVFSVNVMKAYHRDSRGVAPLILNLGSIWR
jgi:hypothetical protein